ncbi:MAG TPA: YdcF family protein [Acidimicrobiales bacterium]
MSHTAELPTASGPGRGARARGLRRLRRTGSFDDADDLDVGDVDDMDDLVDVDEVDEVDGSGRGRRRLRLGRLLVRAVAIVALVGLLYVGITFVQVWSASRRDGARPSDAIVVLGAANYDCEPSPVLRQRLDHALELHRDGIAPTIVVTGGKQEGDRCTEAAAGASYLQREGVAEGDLLLESQGRNSWESIAASARILRDRDMSRVVLVTDGYHALRVQAIADELGLDAVVSPSGGRATAPELIQETGAVAIGRIVGFRRLVNLDDRLVRSTSR